VPETLSEPKLETSILEVVKDLCKIGLYKDALNRTQEEWGAIESWDTLEKQLVASKLYLNLGGDRKSDALLLNLWRKNKDNPELLVRILFYQLNNFGPIIASEFLQKHEATILQDKKYLSELLGFKSIIQKIYHNFSKADALLDKAITIEPSESWFTSLKIQLLSEQNDLEKAKHQAEQHFDAYPSPFNLRTLSNILTKKNGLSESIALYEQYAENYQSASVWLEYGQLLAGNHEWEKCEYVIKRFEETRIVIDKGDEQILIAWKGQIAINKQKIEESIEVLSRHKGSYWKIVVENLKKSDGILERKVLDVPFLKQEHMTCAPTTLAALCRFWGDEVDSKEVADAICFDGTPATKERQWLRDNNYYFKEFELAPTLAYSLIENDIPFALVTTHGFSAHIQAVIGFNKQVGTLYVMDPSFSIMQETLTKETIESEAYSGARCIVFLPENKAHLLSKFEFPASDQYVLWDTYSIAEENNNYVLAKEALDKLQLLDSEHRITLRVERNFALWNNDTVKILELNNKLLEKYPDETLLHTSKYFCLRDLGKRELGLTKLSEYLGNTINLDILGTLFDEIYDTSEHELLTIDTFNKLKEFGGYSSYSHWSLANYYWAQQNFELATEHYLNAYCLDETNERYIESYFRASRHLQREHESIEFLKGRFDKYKVRSAMPAISLYKAYEILDQEHIGIDYLFEALTTHPDDIHLIKYLSNKLIENGLISKFENIESKIEPYLNNIDFDELIARKNERQGDFESALTFFTKSFNENPFIQKYANGYFRLLFKRGDQKQIDSLLEALFEKNPQNTQILDYIADWHSEPNFQEEILTKFVELRPDFGAIRRQLIDVRLKLGLFDKAFEEAVETCRVIVGEHINQSYLAKCYLRRGDFVKARDIAKKVLSLTIDSELAFSTLLEGSITQDEKEASLAFAFYQISEQVLLGDAAWYFWFEAKSILSQEKLKEFIEHLLEHEKMSWHTYSIGASFYKQYGELGRAKELLLQGQSKFPLTPRLYSDLGELYELEGDINKSIAANKQALVLNPSWAHVTKRLSEIFEKHKDIESAIDIVKKGIKHNPTDGILFGYLADLFIKKDLQKEAIEPLKNAVKNNTDYRWAWSQLINISNEVGESNLPLKFAQTLAEQSPYFPHVWRDLAYLTKEHDKKLNLLDKSLNCDAYFIPSYQDKMQYYVEIGDYKLALEVLDNTPWKDDLPTDLTIQKVDLLTEIGQKKEAIKLLKHVLFNVHGQAYLWKKLFNLLEQQDTKEEYIDCCHKSVTQNRHDPEILCYAGENLLKHGNENEKKIANEYLKKAFEFSPNEEYIVLTYVDNLINSEKYEEALSALMTFENINKVNYATTRKIITLCKLDRAQEALCIFSQMVNEQESEYWCLNQSVINLNKHFSFEEITAVFKEHSNELTREQAYFYIDKSLNLNGNNKFKNVLKLIGGFSNNDAWIGSFIALLEFWRDKEITPPENVIDLYFERIVNEVTLVEQLGSNYIYIGHYHSMVKLFEKVKNKGELPAYSYYHYRLALQMLGRWDDATQAIFQGVKQQPDNTVHNMRLWYAYELIRIGKPLTYADLEVIDYEELIDMERYVYSTLLVILQLGNTSLEDKLEEIDPLLRKCQQAYQAANGQNLAVHARNSLKSRLKGAVSATGFFEKLKVKWWISNRF